MLIFFWFINETAVATTTTGLRRGRTIYRPWTYPATLQAGQGVEDILFGRKPQGATPTIDVKWPTRKPTRKTIR